MHQNICSSLNRRAAKLVAAATILTTIIAFTAPRDANAASVTLASTTDPISQYTGISYNELGNYFLNKDNGYLTMGYFATGDNGLGVFTKTMPIDLSPYQVSELSINFQVFVGNSSYNNFNFALNGTSGTSSIRVDLSAGTGLNIDTAFHTLTFQLAGGALTTAGAKLDGNLIDPTFLSSGTDTSFSLADFTSWTLLVGNNYYTDMGVNIDTITLQAVPEPESVALIFGASAMLFVVLRNRRR